MTDRPKTQSTDRRLADVVREVKIAAADRTDVVVDMRDADRARLELLAQVKERFPNAYGILLTAYADMEVLVDALNSGAVDRYVPKPRDSKELAAMLRQGIDAHATLAENERLREQLRQYAGYLESQQDQSTAI